MQTSESFRLSAILSFSGGLQDAYTYNTRGSVFANAQTGNVVLMSQNLMMGNWKNGMLYLLPLTAFAAGIFIAEQIENRYKNSRALHWRQIILLIEIVMLGAVGFMPQELNMIANMMVSFSCAMQVQTFRKVHGYGYASTMCIGNLRSGTDAPFLWHHIDLCYWGRHRWSSVEFVWNQDNLGFHVITAGCYVNDGEGMKTTITGNYSGGQSGVDRAALNYAIWSIDLW